MENFTQKKEISLIQSIVTKWKEYTAHKIKISKILQEHKTVVENRNVKRGFSVFKRGIEKLKESKMNHQKADLFFYQNTCRKVKAEWMNQVIRNREETQKVVRIRNMRTRKIVTQCWEFMLKKTEVQRAKI